MGRRPFSERAFHISAAGALIFEVGFIIAVIAAAAVYVDLEDLRNTVTSPQMRYAMGMSLATVTLTTLISAVLAIPAAYALSHYRIPLAPAVDTILDLPIVMPPIAAGMTLLVLFGYYLGEPMRAWGIYLPHTPAGVVVAQFFTTMTFAVRSCKAALDGINPRLTRVARTLGSNEWRAFRRVTLPLAKPGLIAGIVVTWARCLGLFGPVVMFCGATEFRTQVMPTAIYINTSVGKLEEAVAGALILVVFALITLVIFKRLGGRGYMW
jgi:molybdate transport system permease protein